ncbi:Gfo/Idh/MocA family oxidoreductase [Variovorax sp. J22R133]|uniref:Gfo/Idh/MocA family protein n=1 Tax=Variovorax brevis TaxID=3053503 RepID=UPI002576BD16|nr:Gfo/Idh/MocA family oxidoreductase [Variovorax sp. J22R133]MDM0115215.1 Gfo/Idh/MocA family oxidoreductase [Variovorax sp. J22R133]
MTIEGSKTSAAPRRIRLGMVGGGQGAFIGGVHRIAARLDDAYELVAGALSSDAARAAASAAELHIAPERSYADFAAMAKAEASREDGIDVVSIVTPNHLHAPIARAFLDAGIDVICDKPVTTTLAEAIDLVQRVRESKRLFALTHNYSGYPMVRQAREMVAAGELGEIRLVHAEYPQDWLSTDLESTGQKQASWRVDPAQAGAGGSLGDIGTHAEHLGRFISGLELQAVSADLTTFVECRRLDDNAHVLMRYTNGARGMVWSSQVAPGNENGLRVRVYGTKAGLEFRQEQPNHLWFTPLGQAPRLITRGGAAAGAAAGHATRIPAGHPEGYLEGFAQLYRDVAEQLHARWESRAPDPKACSVPTVEDGARGMKFIEAVVESSRADGRWVDARLQL